jgi:hypothetical protein
MIQLEDHETQIQRVLKIMHRDAQATHRLCGGEMKDIPFVEEPHEMAQNLLEAHNER